MEQEPLLIHTETLDGEIEARLVESILKERDIPHVLLSHHSAAYDGIFQMQKGWGVVRVEPRDAEEVAQIIQDVRNPEAVCDGPVDEEGEQEREGPEEPEPGAS